MHVPYAQRAYSLRRSALRRYSVVLVTSGKAGSNLEQQTFTCKRIGMPEEQTCQRVDRWIAPSEIISALNYENI